MNECLLIASTSLDLIEKINAYVNPILELALIYLQPRACDEIEMNSDPMQYYNRIELLFLDSSNRLPCARSQFAYLLRNSTKQPGIASIMITKCLKILTQDSPQLNLGCLTLLFLLLDTSYIAELHRSASIIDLGIKSIASNPVAFSYVLMMISQMPEKCKILEHLPLTQDFLLQNLPHKIVQKTLEVAFQHIIRSNRDTIVRLATPLLQQVCETSDMQSLLILMGFVNECLAKKAIETLSIDLAAKTIFKVITNLDFENCYSATFGKSMQSLMELFDCTFGLVYKAVPEAILRMRNNEIHDQVIVLLSEMLHHLGSKVSNSNINIIDDLIFKILVVILVIKDSKPQ